MNTLTTLDLPAFMNAAHRNFIGVDRLMDRMASNLSTPNDQGYPPYNVVKLDDNNFVIELAVAGFGKDSINLTVQDSVLSIEGSHAAASACLSQETNDDDEANYLHKGISSRKFRRTFDLADYVEVTDATVKDGVLKVTLERHIPEELKPREIPVNFK